MLFRLLDRPDLLVILTFCLIFALSFHEFAHAWVANRFGDPTAKLAGRLTTNPLVHLDLMGGLMLLMVGIGYAKPVPVNPRNFRNPNAEFFVAAAGPVMNLALGLLAGLLFSGFRTSEFWYNSPIPLEELFYLFMLLNFNLFFFNMIPVGPLDGSHVLPRLLPRDLRRRYEDWNFRFGTMLLIGLLAASYFLPGFSAFRWISQASRQMIVVLL